MESRFNRKTPRLAGFDYSSSGSYFITICTLRMELRFGSVIDGCVDLNDAGTLVTKIWEEDVAGFAGLDCGAFILMPNHLHAIVQVGTDPDEQHSSLLSLVNSFKSKSTVEYSKGVRDGRFPRYDGSLWQRSFYDRILRNELAIEAARKYIYENPFRWEEKQREFQAF